MIHHLKFCQNSKYFIQKYFKTGGDTSKNKTHGILFQWDIET